MPFFKQLQLSDPWKRNLNGNWQHYHTFFLGQTFTDPSGSALHLCSGKVFWFWSSSANCTLDILSAEWFLIFILSSIAISGNVADFLQKSVAMDDHKWHYDFHKVSICLIWHLHPAKILYRIQRIKPFPWPGIFQVSLAATAVFSYASILPASLYGFLWWAGGAGARWCVDLILVYFD